MTLLGTRSSTTFNTDAATAQAFTDTEITANTITFTGAHGFATGKRNLLFTTTAGTPPTGLVTGTVYQFTVVNTTVVTKTSIGTDASVDFAGTLSNSVDVHNSIAVGYDAIPTKPHQVMLGNSDIVETVLRGAVAFSTIAEPSCAAATRGQLVYVAGGAGVADTFRICTKDGADAYAYRALY
jgi:hypothetical protein